VKESMAIGLAEQQAWEVYLARLADVFPVSAAAVTVASQ
jgi:hypothetical protein